MRFYDTLQLNPSDLKKKLASAKDKREKNKIFLAMLVRAILIVMFSVLFIAPATTFFGNENSSLAVALVCILLSVRFVDFGYCVRDSLVNMFIVFFLLVAAPALAEGLPAILGAIVHFIAFFVILIMSSNEPIMGNGGLYAFSYIFLVGNPVHDELLLKRFELALVGYIICAVIFYYKHRFKNSEVSFISVLKSFSLSNSKCLWQIQFALGVSILLGICELFSVERMMWAGFACASLLGCYSSSTDIVSQTRERFFHRIVGAVLGSGLFAIAYTLTPPEYYSLFGPIGGIFLGFCTDYRYKTAINCFGALLLATGLYGLHGSIILRIVNNLIGAAFGYGFSYLYNRLTTKKLQAV